MTKLVRIFAGRINLRVAVGAILAFGLGAMALASGNSMRTERAASTKPAEHAAAEKRMERSGTFLGYKIVY